jgi:hypothetical protein
LLEIAAQQADRAALQGKQTCDQGKQGRLLQNSRRKIASEASSVWDVVVSVSLSWLSLPDWSIFPDATRVDPAAVATTR